MTQMIQLIEYYIKLLMIEINQEFTHKDFAAENSEKV